MLDTQRDRSMVESNHIGSWHIAPSKNTLVRTCSMIENFNDAVEKTKSIYDLSMLNDTKDVRNFPPSKRRTIHTDLGIRWGAETDRPAERSSSVASLASTSSTSSRAFVYSPNQLIPIIPGELYFTVQPDEEQLAAAKSENQDFCFFSTAHHASFLPFNDEIGPVDLGVIVSFWRELRELRERLASRIYSQPLVYYSLSNPGHATNAALLLASFLILELKFSASQAAAAFEAVEPSPFASFRDASGMEDFTLSLHDCLGALEQSLALPGWFDPHTFDVEGFEQMATPGGGDLTMMGGKFIAFKGPVTDEAVRQQRQAQPAASYAEEFQRLGVGLVVRLNAEEEYDAAEFTARGLRHEALPFPDGGRPSRAVAKRFLDLCDSTEGVVAVHCKAGLGRTGTLIALWTMKNLGLSAKQAIALMRLSRPGSVIGSQQSYLARCELRAWNGNLMLKTPSTTPAAE